MTTRKVSTTVFRNAAISLSAVLLMLLGVEAALRTDTLYDFLPAPRPYYVHDVSRRLRGIERLRREHDRIDVLFVGSSVVRADFQPERFDQLMRKLTRKPMLSFNGGLQTMFPSGLLLYMRHVWLDAAHPRYVFHGVREAELATRAGPSYLRRGPTESGWLENTWLSRLRSALIEHLRLAQYAGSMTKILGRLSDGTLMNTLEEDEQKTDGRGWRAERVKLARKRKAKSGRLWKYHHQVNPKRYDRVLPMLTEMHELCERAGAQYVLVNMPEHPARFDTATGHAIFDDYEQRIRAWAANNDVPFLDVTNSSLDVFTEDELYSDYHHMSPKGARKFTDMLAAEFARYLRKHPGK
jgi:hypothetical protein